MIPKVMALAKLLHAADYQPTALEMVEARKLFWDNQFAEDIEEARDAEYRQIDGLTWTADFLYYCIAWIQLVDDLT